MNAHNGNVLSIAMAFPVKHSLDEHILSTYSKLVC